MSEQPTRLKTYRKRGWLPVWQDMKAAQLLEFALVLPFLAVMVVGIADFGAAWALKDKLANAARDGARIAVSQINDLTSSQRTACNGVPCSVQSTATAVVNYLTKAPVNTCGLNPSSSAPTVGPSAFTWTYFASGNQCAGTMSVKVERAVAVPSNGTTLLCTRVTVTYPFAWSFGRVVKLLAPSSNYGNTLTFSTAETMQNLN